MRFATVCFLPDVSFFTETRLVFAVERFAVGACDRFEVAADVFATVFLAEFRRFCDVVEAVVFLEVFAPADLFVVRFGGINRIQAKIGGAQTITIHRVMQHKFAFGVSENSQPQ